MKTLKENWLTEGLMDFEYKKYILLAYLTSVKQNFKSAMLYPHLSDLVFHYQNLLALKENKQMLNSHFPKELSKADLDTIRLEYKKMVEDDEFMKVLEDIVLYAVPQFKKMLEEGKNIYEHIEENLQISMVGLSPLRFDEGYFFLREENKREMKIFEYQITIFENATEKMRGIHTNLLETMALSLGSSLVSIKTDLIRRYKKLPNPATYFIYSKFCFPLQESLLPVAKRLLVKHIASQ